MVHELVRIPAQEAFPIPWLHAVVHEVEHAVVLFPVPESSRTLHMELQTPVQELCITPWVQHAIVHKVVRTPVQDFLRTPKTLRAVVEDLVGAVVRTPVLFLTQGVLYVVVHEEVHEVVHVGLHVAKRCIVPLSKGHIEVGETTLRIGCRHLCSWEEHVAGVTFPVIRDHQ